ERLEAGHEIETSADRDRRVEVERGELDRRILPTTDRQMLLEVVEAPGLAGGGEPADPLGHVSVAAAEVGVGGQRRQVEPADLPLDRAQAHPMRQVAQRAN